MSQANKDLLLYAHDEIFNRGNVDAVDDVFVEDYLVRSVAGDRVGRDQVKELAYSLRSSFPDLEVAVVNMVAEGDLVAWQRNSHGTHNREHAGVPPSGRHVAWQTYVISKFRDGKIVEESGATNVVSALMRAGCLT